jgi:glutathione peroxidase
MHLVYNNFMISVIGRVMLMLAAMSAALPALGQPNMTRVTAYAFSFKSIGGEDIRLSAHTGKPILVVNTASLCGYTPQYAGLQELWQRYRDRGLLIVAVPSNDFGSQEPGDEAEIEQTARGRYGISFPLAVKAEVKGAGAHPFFKWAALDRPGEAPRWNFHKYIIGRDGRIKAVFASAIEPTDARVIAVIEQELPPR